jgi:hypothetical protein
VAGAAAAFNASLATPEAATSGTVAVAGAAPVGDSDAIVSSGSNSPVGNPFLPVEDIPIRHH